MPTLAERFGSLPAARRKEVQIALCRDALRIWDAYCREHGPPDYVESVCGTVQRVEPDLPAAAIRSVVAGADAEEVAARYREPVSALQDDDLRFPDEVEYAYYAIYNLFQRHVAGTRIDDWVIVNQALASQGRNVNPAALLESSIHRTDPADAASGSPPPLSSPDT